MQKTHNPMHSRLAGRSAQVAARLRWPLGSRLAARGSRLAARGPGKFVGAHSDFMLVGTYYQDGGEGSGRLLKICGCIPRT